MWACPGVERAWHLRFAEFADTDLLAAPVVCYLFTAPNGAVNARAFASHKLFKPALVAGLAALCGLALWRTPFGDAWVNTSYDYLFRFGSRHVTNELVLVLMDNESIDYFGQTRGQAWARELHTQLLDRLASDGCALVIFDVFFKQPGDPAKDRALADAMARQRGVVLMAEHAGVSLRHIGSGTPNAESARPLLPAEPFLSAARTNWGVAWLDPDLDRIVRRHWPFPAPGPYLSLPSTAARLVGAKLGSVPEKRWLRYYGPNGHWTELSYKLALTCAPNFFKDKIVFIGNKPRNSIPNDEPDKFSTPYTRWTGEAAGGMEIMATAFLNLVNGDWLRRSGAGTEASVLLVCGLGAGLACYRRRALAALGVAAGLGLALTVAGVSLSQVTHYWFPWLVVVGGQIPLALVCALTAALTAPKPAEAGTSLPGPQSGGALASADDPTIVADLPDAPDYEVLHPPFGEGAYGKVWLARNAVGQWQALKAVYRAKFGPQTHPYDRELSGITRYKPISDKHPSLLRVDFVSREKPGGYFYYVMELGDAMVPGWETNPSAYVPRDLARVLAGSSGRRLPKLECVRIALSLAEGLEFLHREGLTHRDIKPSNIIFVKGQPKLADVGLVVDVAPSETDRTWVGTPGYMPPAPEPPGTPAADIYGLGIVMYVMMTGRHPSFFPELASSLVDQPDPPEFARLNSIVLKACDPNPARRYVSASAMAEALRQLQKELECAAR